MDGLSDAQITELKELFALFDESGDGTICTNELGTLLRACGLSPSEKDLSDMVLEYDTNGSKSIDFSEFLLLMKKCKMQPQDTTEDIKMAFKAFDTDGNGFIGETELRQALQSMGEKLSDRECEVMLRDADIDGDGKINYEEFAKMMMK